MQTETFNLICLLFLSQTIELLTIKNVFRNRCNGSKDNERCNLEKPEFEKYGVAPVKTQHIAKDGDWDCWK